MTAVRSSARARLHANGFVHVPAVLDERTTAALRHALDAWVGTAEPDGPYGVLRHDPWRCVAEVEALVRGGPVPALVAALLGEEEVVLFQDHLAWKPPGTADEVRWHQDFAYWPLDAPDGLTVWIALDAADARNGCLQYVPGTHLEGERRAADFVTGARRTEVSALPPIEADGRKAVTVEAAEGDVIVHHPLVWHRSPPNRSARHRRALSQSWITPRVCWDADHAAHPATHELAPRAGAPVEGPRFPRWSRA